MSIQIKGCVGGKPKLNAARARTHNPCPRRITLGTDRPANRVDAVLGQGRVVERERELRGTGALSVPDAGGAEQQR